MKISFTHMFSLFFTFCLSTISLAQEVQPAAEARVQAGAMLRLSEPHLYDMIFPVVALVFVILIPTGIALWAMWRTWTDKTTQEEST